MLDIDQGVHDSRQPVSKYSLKFTFPLTNKRLFLIDEKSVSICEQIKIDFIWQFDIFKFTEKKTKH